MYNRFEDKVSVRVVGITQPVIETIPDSEGIASYAARVSNPSNQDNFDTANKLLKYCAENGHWSVFETVNAVVEIKAPRDISRQVLRHGTAKFQEFSQRYSVVDEDSFVTRECRMQDSENRQNSIECEDGADSEWFINMQQEIISLVRTRYQEAISRGIAKESARVILPEGNTMSCMYMNATLRTWVHYCNVREGNGTQKEHTVVANKVREALCDYFPNIMEI